MHAQSQVWDLGGQTSIRPYWRCYFPNTDAIIFVVDSADVERLAIAKQELCAMLEEEELRDSILLVFANKQDQKGALNASQVTWQHMHPFTYRFKPAPSHPLPSLSSYYYKLTLPFSSTPIFTYHVPVLQISEALGLPNLRNRQWSIQETSATKGKGLFEGFDWLSTAIMGGGK